MVSSTASAAAAATGLPPKVVPWLPGWSSVGRVAGRQAGADREAAGQALGDGDDVGDAVDRVGDEGVLVGEPGAGAPDAGLDLVEPQQGAVLAGDLTRPGEVVVRGGDHARLPLERLEDDGRGLVGDGSGQRIGVAVGHERDVARQRLERLAVGLLGGQRERAHRAAVEGALGGDHVGAAGASGQLEGRLVGLGAGVGEEHLAGAIEWSDARSSLLNHREEESQQPLGERDLRARWRRSSRRGPSVCSWSVTASTSAGWAWPSELTAMPPRRSR